MLVGGIALNFGDGGSSYRVGAGRDFVIEGDEYDSAFFDKTAKFLKYLPDVAVINNIEFDHADIYADLDAVRLAFRRLVNLVPRNGLLLLGADSPDAAALRERGGQPGRDLRPGATARPGRRATSSTRDGVTHFKVRRRRRSCSAVRVAAARPAQRAQRARRDCGRRQRRARRRRRWPTGLRAVQGHQAAARNGRRRRGVTVLRRLRASSDGGARDAVGAAHRLSRAPDLGGVRAALGVVVPARLSAGFRRARSARPTKSSSRPYSARRCPKSERLSAEQLVDDLRGAGQRARHIPEVDDIVGTIVARTPRRRRRRADVQRRLRRHSPEAAAGARWAGVSSALHVAISAHS